MEQPVLPPSPTKAWEILKSTNTVENVKPMDLNTPIYPDMVRFVCVSDTHSLENRMPHQIPPGDILIHAGDFTNVGELKEVKEFNERLGILLFLYFEVLSFLTETFLSIIFIRESSTSSQNCDCWKP